MIPPIHDPVNPPTEIEEAPARSRSRSPLALALVVLLGAVFLGQRLFVGDPAVEDRVARVGKLEESWGVRRSAGRAIRDHRDARERIERSRKELLDPLDLKPWRGRSAPVDAPSDQPPVAPTLLRGALDPERAVISLRWVPPAGADSIEILRSRPEDESTVRMAEVDGLAESWDDEVYELSGDYVYHLQARRGSLVGPVATRKVSFRIEPRIAVLGVDPRTRTAKIEVGPEKGGPRPTFFETRTFLVKVGDGVGSQVMGFDYRTGYVLEQVGEVEGHEWVDAEVPRFAADGKRERDARGRAMFKVRKLRRSVWKPFAHLTGDGLEPLTLHPPR